jgi:hypothetical protein
VGDKLGNTSRDHTYMKAADWRALEGVGTSSVLPVLAAMQGRDEHSYCMKVVSSSSAMVMCWPGRERREL